MILVPRVPWVFSMLLAFSMASCRQMTLPVEGSSMHSDMQVSTTFAYLGRLTLKLPAPATTAISDASYNGIRMVRIPAESLRGGVEAYWRQRTANIAVDGKRRILDQSSTSVDREILYKFLALENLGPKSKVTLLVLHTTGADATELSVTATYAEVELMKQQMRNVVLHLGPPDQRVDASTLVSAGADVLLAPDIGESVNGNVNFGIYSLEVSTDVLRQPEPTTVIRDAKEPAPPGLTTQILIEGNVQAGSFSGEQAVIALKDKSAGTYSYLGIFQSPGTAAGDPLHPTLHLRMTAGPTKDARAAAEFLMVWQQVLAGVAVRGAETRRPRGN